MKAVWRFCLDVVDQQTIKAPVGAKFLCVQEQHGLVCLWAEVETDNDVEDRVIVTHGTGHEVMDGLSYIGTYQAHGGCFVGHVFEPIKEEQDNWNRRPLEDAKDAAIERLRGLLGEAVECVEHDADAMRIIGADTGQAHYVDLAARIDAELKGDGDG